MKIKTFLPKRARKFFDRLYRFNPVAEWFRCAVLPIEYLNFNCRNGDLRVRVDQADILLDCGANVGDITSMMARTGAVVYAFEPDPNAFSVLCRRFKFVKNVKVLNVGVMDKDGVLSFHLFGSTAKDPIDSSVGSSFVPEKNMMNPGGVVQVNCVRLADFLLRLGKTVRLVKMDIEGAEVSVLDDLFSTSVIDKIEYMLVETHERQMPFLGKDIDRLRAMIFERSLGSRIRFDWV